MSMPTTSQRALTVLVVPHAQTDEIVAVLADYSAVGLLAAFAWVDAADVGGASTPATVVGDGRSEPVVLQQLLTAQRYDRIRVAVLVPTEAPTDCSGCPWCPNRSSSRLCAAARWVRASACCVSC